jgi:hypothetical protein
MKMGMEAVQTGNSVAKPKLSGRETGDEGEVAGNSEYRSFLQDIGESAKMPWLGTTLRVGVGPGLEAVRFVDEMTWATTFDMARRTIAAGRVKSSGRSLEEVMQDPDVTVDAAVHADRVTQRTRPDEKTAFGKAFRAVEVLRSPTLGGSVPYNPLFHFMPIYRSVALLTAEAGKMILAPARGAQAVMSLRALRSPEKLQAYADAMNISPEAAKRQLSQRFFDQLTDAAMGAVGYAAAAALGSGLLPAPRGGTESASETKVRDLANPQGAVAGVNTTRMSPVYETLQAAATARDLASGKLGAEEGIVGLGRALLDKPLLGGIKGLLGKQTNPKTGEPMSTPDYMLQQMRRQALAIGSPWASTARAGETEQHRVGDSDALTPVGDQRVKAYGLTGEGRPTPAGILTRGLVGTGARAGANEKQLAALLVRLNDAQDAKVNEGRPAGSRAKSPGAFWPSSLAKDLPTEEDRRFVERMTPEQQERMNELTGRAWWAMLEPRMQALEKLGETNPGAALKRMSAMRSGAAARAKATILRERSTAQTPR